MSEHSKANEAGAPPMYQATGTAPAQYTDEAPPKYEATPQGQQFYPSQQPAGYQAGYTQPVIVMNQPLAFSNNPARICCPYCRAEITTATEFEAGALTWLTSGVLCLVGCWLGCCLIPFCINDLQDVKHKCPNCGKVVGVNRRL